MWKNFKICCSTRVWVYVWPCFYKHMCTWPQLRKMCMIKLLLADMSHWLVPTWTCTMSVSCHYFVVCINFCRDFSCTSSFWFLHSGLCLWYWTVSIVQMVQLVLQHRAGWSVPFHLMMLHGFLNQSCCCCFIQRHSARPSTTSNRKIQQVKLFLDWNCKC